MLCFTGLTGLPQSSFRAISKLDKLYEVNLSFCADTDDLDVGLLCEGVRGLRKLHLSHTKITDRGLIFVQKLKLLEELHVANCCITDDGISHLYTLKNLRLLCLSNAFNLSDTGLSRLCMSTSLQSLDVSFCGRITDKGVLRICNLPRVRELNLSFTAVSDFALGRLCSLSTLRKLDISFCNGVSDAGIQALCQSSTGLKVLSIQSCNNVSEKIRKLAHKRFECLRYDMQKVNICVCDSREWGR